MIVTEVQVSMMYVPVVALISPVSWMLLVMKDNSDSVVALQL